MSEHLVPIYGQEGRAPVEKGLPEAAASHQVSMSSKLKAALVTRGSRTHCSRVSRRSRSLSRCLRPAVCSWGCDCCAASQPDATRFSFRI